MRYNRNRGNAVRTIIAKYTGRCGNCGGTIQAGAMCDYDPAKRQIGHLHAFSGDGDKMQQCFSSRKEQETFIDIDRAYEDQCADICGR